jgi:hypothetical protein
MIGWNKGGGVPYIRQELRPSIDRAMESLLNMSFTQGELNYVITHIIRSHLKTHGESYQTHNDIVGVLECAKMEHYRTMTSKYEDIKKQSNGDVIATQAKDSIPTPYEGESRGKGVRPPQGVTKHKE